MATVGSLLFCTACGDLLSGSIGDPKHVITCTVCGAKNNDVQYRPVMTASKPSAFPSALRSKHSNVQAVSEEETNKEALIENTCPECGNPEMLYYTQQLRSADEGTTVFYTCPKCGHKYNTNN